MYPSNTTTEPRMQAHAATVKQIVPGAKLVRYDDAGHALFVDDAERFNKDLQELLAEVNQRAASRR